MEKHIAIPSGRSITFDIETGPLSAEYLDMIAPTFEPPSNYKDPEKIAANLAEQKAKWVDRAALSPMTGRVLCVGVRDVDGSFRVIDGGGDESELLKEWAEIFQQSRKESFVGFNINSFDAPFLLKRAWKLGVRPFLRPGVKFAYMDNWVDLRDVWQCGDRQAEGSLDAISKFLGVGAKNGEGKNFHLLWKDDRDAALAYLKNDINLTYDVAVRMGVIVD